MRPLKSIITKIYRRAGVSLVCGSLLMLLLHLSSCSGAPPEVAQLFWQLNVVENIRSAEQYEELTVFVHIQDPDGISDIEEIKIFHAQGELLWEYTADDWQQVERDGQNWFGSNGIRCGFSQVMPRGEYRVKISDRAGESVETTFIISHDLTGLQKGRIEKNRFPSMTVTTDQLTIVTNAPEVAVSLYDKGQNFKQSSMLKGSSFDGTSSGSNQSGTADADKIVVSDWQSKLDEAQFLWLHSYNSSDGFGLVSGPYKAPLDEDGS